MSPLKCLWMTTSLSLWFAATPGPRLARAARSQPRLRTIVAAPEVQVQCSGVWCGVSPLESPHLLTTAGPVVAHSYTRTGTPAHGTLARTGDKQRISAGPLRSADR